MNNKQLETIVLELVGENEDQQKQIKTLNDYLEFLQQRLLEFQDKLANRK